MKVGGNISCDSVDSLLFTPAQVDSRAVKLVRQIYISVSNYQLSVKSIKYNTKITVKLVGLEIK